MAKPYDATGKDLIELAPAAWLEVLGVHRPADRVAVIDADVSTVTAAADKVIRVADDPPWLLHVELETGGEETLPGRMLMYNAILRVRHGLEVSSVVFLMRPVGTADAFTGRLPAAPPFGPAWEFGYTVVRVWELPVERLLSGPLAVVPLAAAAADRAGVAAVAVRAAERLQAEAAPPIYEKLMSALGVFIHMRFADMSLQEIMARNPHAQAFFGSAFDAERMKGARAIILRVGRKRFGPPTAEQEAAVNAIADLARLEALSERLLDVSSWAELLAE